MVVKNIFLILILTFLVGCTSAQVKTEKSLFLNYEIKNEILKKEIDNFIKENKDGYKDGDKVIWLTINFDLKSSQTVYKIGYKTDFDFFSIKENKVNRFDHPDIITRYKEEYLFVYIGFPNDIFIDDATIFEIAKVCFPNQYNSYLKDVIRINGSHQQPALELKFKYGKLISKRKYNGHF